MGVLVGKPAPDFTVPAVLGDGSIVDEFTLSEAIKGKYGLVFFYPLDSLWTTAWTRSKSATWK